MKSIPIALQTHMQQYASTTTQLLRVGPLPDGTTRGFTLLDIDVVYDDGDGSIAYKASTGMQMSALVSSSDLSVDNAEAETLLPSAGYEADGFTRQQVDAGVLDSTPFVVYRINYEDLTAGSHEIVDGGTIGEVRRKVGGLAVLELRALTQRLMQSIVERDSKSCRAKHGSQPIGTGGGAFEQRFPCGFDLSTAWVAGAVQVVGAENDREFTDTGLTQAADYFVPGVLRWTAGNNVGQEMEIEAFASAAVTLQFPTVNPILLGDEYEIRRDCTHEPSGHNSCRTFFDTAWVEHFRGEPYIPTGDTGGINSPGAGLAGNLSSTGEPSE